MRTKVLFIDRDGTLVIPINYQIIDTLDQVIFYPGAISYLVRIATELDYELVMVTTQDGLGTESFPRVLFQGPHEYILRTFEREGIHFSSVYIDHSKYKTRNHGIGMLSSYFSKTYDRSQSFVIGITDVLLAKTLGSQSICMKNGLITTMTKEEDALHTSSWKAIYKLLKFGFSECSYRRRTKETEIQLFIKIDGKGISDIHTGFGFFDHMLDQICIHANIDLSIKVKGDLHVDEHHTIEDTAITLGIALSKTLKDKRGIARYGFLLPMDDALVQVALDLGGRRNLVWKADFKREKIGDLPTEMFSHFFKSFSDVAYCNIHIQAEGNNEHHKIEAIFKAFACALHMATRRNHNNDRLPSTKDIL